MAPVSTSCLQCFYIVNIVLCFTAWVPFTLKKDPTNCVLITAMTCNYFCGRGWHKGCTRGSTATYNPPEIRVGSDSSLPYECWASSMKPQQTWIVICTALVISSPNGSPQDNGNPQNLTSIGENREPEPSSPFWFISPPSPNLIHRKSSI